MTTPTPEEGDDVPASPRPTDRWDALDFAAPPSDVEEPDSPVLMDYTSEGKIAMITLNRPHADNAITTEMGARLTEVVEGIAVRTAVRVVGRIEHLVPRDRHGRLVSSLPPEAIDGDQ